MYDFAFDLRQLNRELVRSDFSPKGSLSGNEVEKKLAVSTALQQAQNGFLPLALNQSLIRSKFLYQLKDPSQNLILRKLDRNIRVLTSVKQQDRDTIIRSLKAIFSEGQKYRIYRLDIREFYESININLIHDFFKSDHGFPAPSLRVFKSLTEQLTAMNIKGLPRGIAISATLSEYLLRKFDLNIGAQQGVYYYARYVDDMIIITTGAEDGRKFFKYIKRALPTGLHLNSGKSRFYDLTGSPKKKNAVAGIENKIDFLGYHFDIYEQQKGDAGISRLVELDIAPNKVNRIKTRLCLSMIQFIKDGIFSDLNDRLLLLSSNYNLYDLDKKLQRNVGLCWNYRHVDPSKSKSLTELDAFLQKTLLAKKGRMATRFNAKITSTERRQLLGLSFLRSFKLKKFHHFNGGRLAHLASCWTYE